MISTTVGVCVGAGVISGLLGFWISSLYMRSKYAANAEFGGYPIIGGALIVMALLLCVRGTVVPDESAAPAALTAMIVGCLGGFLPMILVIVRRSRKSQDDDDKKPDDK